MAAAGRYYNYRPILKAHGVLTYALAMLTGQSLGLRVLVLLASALQQYLCALCPCALTASEIR